MKLALRISFFILLLSGREVYGQKHDTDTVKLRDASGEVFYDSLKTKAYRHGLTRFIYNNIVIEKKGPEDLDFHYRLLIRNRGKIITSIQYKPLDVFGPTLQDTARRPESKIGEFGNRLHTTTSPKIIKKNVLVEVGDTLDVEKVLDNERIIRSLPFIKDVRFLATPDKADTNLVNLTVLTKDVFSFGIGLHFSGVETGSVEMYNQNIWGIGHHIGAKVVGNSKKEPYVGFEGAYSINNIGGNFVNLTTAYANTYRREGMLFDFEKEFLVSTTRWGGGMSFYRLTRSDHLINYDQVKTDFPLSYKSFDIWSGYAFQLNNNSPGGMQLVISGRFRQLRFFDRPEPDPDNRQYYSNSKLYMGSVSFSKRQYIRDQLIYSYGITEDIPKGFLHEWVFGFDNNEFNGRWYSHLYFSTGNLIRYKPSYLFASVGAGSFFNSRHMEQGQIEFNGNYISRLFNVGQQKARQFVRLNYLYGLRRFDEETLFLKDEDGIRGMYSELATGKQRLVLNLETVVFQRRTIAGFNIAFFGFGDLGIIGSEKRPVFKGDYYAGIGGGMRIRNENFVFRTIQIRLALYPNHPADTSGFGFIFTEMGHEDFYSFQPRKPESLQYR
ncbi:MAG: hypothetical protein AAGU19_11755 [Prolixibacteraceae bacterium]